MLSQLKHAKTSDRTSHYQTYMHLRQFTQTKQIKFLTYFINTAKYVRKIPEILSRKQLTQHKRSQKPTLQLGLNLGKMF